MSTFPAAAGNRIQPALINHEYSQTDASSHTVTATVATDLSSVYQIPANDAAVGNGYRLTCYGNGTWGSTQQALTFTINVAGSTLTIVIAATALAASANINWIARLHIVPSAVGAGTGAMKVFIDGVVGETANALNPGTASTNSIPFARNMTASSIDNTAAQNVSVQASWASATGAPTITCVATIFERLG